MLGEDGEGVGVAGEGFLQGLDGGVVYCGPGQLGLEVGQGERTLEPENGSVGGLEAVEFLEGGTEFVGRDNGTEGLDHDVPELFVLGFEKDDGAGGLRVEAGWERG